MKRMVRWLMRIHTSRILVVSAVLTLLALALMVWSMVQPTPLPVMLAMTVGQALGTLAFSLYGMVVALDLFQRRRADHASVIAEPATVPAPAVESTPDEAEPAAEPGPEPEAKP